MSVEIPDVLIDALATRVAAKLAAQRTRAESDTPWMTKRQALAYTRMERSTFEKLAAAGRLPSHGTARVRLFHRDEVDAAIMRDYAPAPSPTALRRAS